MYSRLMGKVAFNSDRSGYHNPGKSEVGHREPLRGVIGVGTGDIPGELSRVGHLGRNGVLVLFRGTGRLFSYPAR